ncbi:MAG: cupredoxin family copper-binding protein [Actinobacteria bacterium]|nr:cupredoxin family copper-binding protein [Actinomycetota bacterium]
MKKLLAVAALCVLVLTLLISAGCGKKTETTTPITPTSSVIKIKDFAFDPAEITVAPGTSVTWINEDSTVHTITTTTFDSGEIKPNEQYKFTFGTPGTYDYVCSIHPSMKGKVIVTGESSSGTVPTIPEPPTPPGY